MKTLWLISSRMAPWYYELAKALTKDTDISITLFTYSDSIEEPLKQTEINGHKAYVARVPGGWFDILSFRLFRVRNLRKQLKPILSDYDCIHAHGTEAQYQLAIKGTSTPVITSIQGVLSIYHKEMPSWRDKRKLAWIIGGMYETRAVKTLKYYFCRTDWDKNFVRSLNSEAHIFHCWEMIREEFFEIDVKSNTSPGVVYFGGTDSRKGYQELLAVFNKVVLEVPEAILYFAGNTNRNFINTFIEENDLKNLNGYNLRVLGHLEVSKHIETFRKSCMMVHPSYIDNSPNTVCEAQIAGLPVIATDVGGVSSLIEHNETGILVGKRDNEVLKEAILDLLNNSELRKKIASKAQAIARQRHSREEIIQNTVRAYEEIIQAKA